MPLGVSFESLCVLLSLLPIPFHVHATTFQDQVQLDAVLHAIHGCSVGNRVGQVDQQLRQATLRSGVVPQNRRKGGVPERLGEALSKSLARASVVRESQEASNHMLEKTCRLLLDKLSHHVAQHRPNCIEPLICCTNVVETVVVKENLLHNEDCNSLAKLRSRLHDSQTQWDNL